MYVLCCHFVFLLICIFFFFFFFFSSRRRHTRCLSDWSSDVCSSDLGKKVITGMLITGLVLAAPAVLGETYMYFRSEERRVGKSVDLGGRRIIKKKKKKKK